MARVGIIVKITRYFGKKVSLTGDPEFVVFTSYTFMFVTVC